MSPSRSQHSLCGAGAALSSWKETASWGQSWQCPGMAGLGDQGCLVWLSAPLACHRQGGHVFCCLPALPGPCWGLELQFCWSCFHTPRCRLPFLQPPSIQLLFPWCTRQVVTAGNRDFSGWLRGLSGNDTKSCSLGVAGGGYLVFPLPPSPDCRSSLRFWGVCRWGLLYNVSRLWGNTGSWGGEVFGVAGDLASPHLWGSLAQPLLALHFPLGIEPGGGQGSGSPS